jgi:RNA polymerase sigma-70 factor (sigma-E family)
VRSAEEEASFEEYVAARYRSLLRTAFLLTGHHHDAEDLVQATLVKVVGAWRRIADRPDAYVRRTMVNEHVSRWRRHRGREVVVERTPELAHRPETDDTLSLQAALGALAPRQRAVVVLRYFEDLTERETAEVLGVSVGTVKSQARDALARLRSSGLVDEPGVPSHGAAGLLH